MKIIWVRKFSMVLPSKVTISVRKSIESVQLGSVTLCYYLRITHYIILYLAHTSILFLSAFLSSFLSLSLTVSIFIPFSLSHRFYLHSFLSPSLFLSFIISTYQLMFYLRSFLNLLPGAVSLRDPDFFWKLQQEEYNSLQPWSPSTHIIWKWYSCCHAPRFVT